MAELGGAGLGETLLTPTRIYVRPILALAEAVTVKAVSHITGGGFFENIPRSLPAGCAARISMDALRVPPIFHLIAAAGQVPRRDMCNTFNMGVGMTVVVSQEEADAALRTLRAQGEDAYVLGDIVSGDQGVILD